jgi:glycosyltransferase involved in cell wall biosynthesis
LKVSIITVAFNSATTIRDTIESVLSQDYPQIEYIVVDGGSTDGTQDIVREYGVRVSRLISEPDRGIYDAMNKGIGLATGEVIGFLNSDDMYMDSGAVSELMTAMNKKNVDCVFADLIYVAPDNPNQILRYYSSKKFHPRLFPYGWMPAHPTFFAKKSVYEKVGPFSLDYKIAADFELLVRMLGVYGASYAYVSKPLVRMRAGGVSTAGLRHSLLLNREIVKACRSNGINTNLAKVLLKIPMKLMELLKGRALN